MNINQKQQFIYEFADRAQAHLTTIEQGLLNLQNLPNTDLVNHILRSVLSLKEGAEVVDLDTIQNFTKNLQYCLEVLRDYPQIKVDVELESLFLQGFDIIDALVQESTTPCGLDRQTNQQLIDQGKPIFEMLNERLNEIINPFLPFSEIEQIFPLTSAVQEIAATYKKKVKIKIKGGEILIRELTLKNFSRLLKHFINNTIAHGIEPPKVRKYLGKSPIGLITIRTFSQSGKVAISFADDGAGIDVERVKAKAIAKGKITQVQAQTISNQEVCKLIFLPDFSTKDEKDFISGLGFGMNAIENEVKKIGGVIEIESQLGQGTTFTVLYP
jgi:chemotaxis protein histidine kinase CheA